MGSGRPPLVIAAGSSIFEQWTAMGELTDQVQIENLAVGGTQTPYWLDRLPEIVASRDPAGVFLYCGSNDLNAERAPAEIVDTLTRTYHACRALAPSHWFWYCGIMKAPQKIPKWDQIDFINGSMKELLTSPETDLYVDPSPALFKTGAAPLESLMRHELYIDDGLHLTVNGYRELGTALGPQLETWIGSLTAGDLSL